MLMSPEAAEQYESAKPGTVQGVIWVSSTAACPCRAGRNLITLMTLHLLRFIYSCDVNDTVNDHDAMVPKNICREALKWSFFPANCK